MKIFKLKSFCKINLLLRVLKRLKNGYHNISSLITFCDLHDVISISETNLLKDKISFSGRFRKKINLGSNTVTKVLHYLRKKKFLKQQSFRINIKKNIPHGSGLGGGSSNAAVLLNFFKSKMRLKISEREIVKIAYKIGFDVPIILKKENTILTGKKNQFLRINNKFNLNIIIVYPNIHCSTEEIYKRNKKFSSNKPSLKYLVKNKNKLIDSLKNENNDLEKTVTKLYPNIKRIINFIKSQDGCHFSRISGSGSSCIGIFSNMKNTIKAQKLVKLKYPKFWCVVSKTI